MLGPNSSIYTLCVICKALVTFLVYFQLRSNMNKDYDLKKDPQYDSSKLRARIDQTIKAVRDETDEVKMPQVKTMPVIPVTGSERMHKYLNNKSPRAY